MKIERTLNGEKIAIELTEQELYEAYLEKKKSFERDFVQGIFDEHDLEYTDEELETVTASILDELNFEDIGEQETRMAMNYIRKRSIYDYD